MGLVVLGLTILSLWIVCVHVFTQPRLSPFDELVYIDYVAKIPEQGVVRMGETLGPLAREAYACRGVMFFENTAAQLCGPADGIDTDYPNHAFTTGDIYAPAYPAVAFAAMRIVMLAGVEDPVDAMRIGGALWLVIAGSFLYAALRRLGSGIVPAIAVNLMLIGSLPALWNHTFVTTDSTLIPAGAVTLWLVVRLLQDGRGVIALPIVSALAVLMKFQNIGVLMAASFVLGTAAAATGIAAARAAGGEHAGRAAGTPSHGHGNWAQPGGGQRHQMAPERAAGSALGAHAVPLTQPRRWRLGLLAAIRSRPAIAVLASVAAAVSALGAWLAIRSSIAIRKPPNHTMYESLEGGDIVNETLRFIIGPAAGVNPMPFGPWAQAQGQLLTVFYLAGLVGVAFMMKGQASLIARCALVAALLLGPVLISVVLLESGRYFALPERYGAGFIPWALAGAAAFAARSRWLPWLLLGAGVLMVVISQLHITLS